MVCRGRKHKEREARPRPHSVPVIVAPPRKPPTNQRYFSQSVKRSQHPGFGCAKRLTRGMLFVVNHISCGIDACVFCVVDGDWCPNPCGEPRFFNHPRNFLVNPNPLFLAPAPPPLLILPREVLSHLS